MDFFAGLDHDTSFEGNLAVSVEQYAPVEYKEKCKAKNCSNGKFIAYPSGRVVGQCFACKGLGYKTFKTSPEAREAAAGARVQKKTQNYQHFVEANPDVVEWIKKNASTFDFARSLAEAVQKYDGLTDGQLAAARRCIAKSAERKAQWDAEKAARITNAPAVATDKLMEAFDKAIASGLRTPKMRFETFQASLAPAHGKNAGAVYVKAGETYLGKIQNGHFYASRECSSEQSKNVQETMADPLTAAVAYGRRTGNCSCCGRTLENKESVELGIGPICRSKFGM